jgi:predicted anti-sigma-YlaC factor YlaD
MTCETTRQAIHEAFDEDRGDALSHELRAHLASCPACRELATDLSTLRFALRALPREPLPPEALDGVWRRTVRANGAAHRPAWGGWRAAAAAVVVTALGAGTLYLVSKPAVPKGPTATDLAVAEAQAEMVFGYTARALAATRNAAAHDVIEVKVSPAVRGAAAPRSSRRSS